MGFRILFRERFFNEILEAKEHEDGHEKTGGMISEDEGEIEPMGDVSEEKIEGVDEGGGTRFLRVV